MRLKKYASDWSRSIDAGGGVNGAPRGVQFLNVLERETSGENDVPHLSSNVRKIVPETRAQSALVSGIAILLTLLLRGEIVILNGSHIFCYTLPGSIYLQPFVTSYFHYHLLN